MAVNLVPHNGVLHIKMMSVGGYRLSCMDMNTFAVSLPRYEWCEHIVTDLLHLAYPLLYLLDLFEVRES